MAVQGSTADKLTLSSIIPTAYDIDLVVAQEQGFVAKENLGVEAIYRIPDLVLKALIAGRSIWRGRALTWA